MSKIEFIKRVSRSKDPRVVSLVSLIRHFDCGTEMYNFAKNEIEMILIKNGVEYEPARA